jgi:hypothetical protein
VSAKKSLLGYDVPMTSAYTFKVMMTIEILAQGRESAEKKLDQEGGYVTERIVELVNTTEIPPFSLEAS